MAESDATAAVNWPQVPACFGWLALDRRGGWLLKREPIRHAGLIAFINGNYGPDDDGNWIFQNGPQAVFVALDYTPLVLRLGADGRLTAHTGVAAGEIAAAYLDEEGNALLHAAAGIGLLDDRDLAAFVAECRNVAGAAATDDALLAIMNGGAGVFWRGLPLHAIRREDVAPRFRFRSAPIPVAG